MRPERVLEPRRPHGPRTCQRCTPMGRNRQLPPWQTSFVLLSAIWGASFMFIKVGLEDLGPLEVAFARCALGALALIALVAVLRQQLPRGREIWARLFVIAIFFNSVPFSLFS